MTVPEAKMLRTGSLHITTRTTDKFVTAVLHIFNSCQEEIRARHLHISVHLYFCLNLMLEGISFRLLAQWSTAVETTRLKVHDEQQMHDTFTAVCG